MESLPLKLSLGGYSNWQIVMINAGVSNVSCYRRPAIPT
jgi:hypothetical protein